MKPNWNARQSAAANARRSLPPMTSDYFALGRGIAAADTASPEELHAFRLETKRFRYTLELFRPCYGPALDRKLDELRKVQQFLGEINDCTVAGRLGTAAIGKPGPARVRFEEFLQQRSAELKEAFRTHWKSVFDAPHREDAWRAYLSRAN